MLTKKDAKKKKCPICGKEKSISSGFYKSASPLYQEDGCVPICISCVKEDVTNEDGSINKSKLKTMLQRLDKPLYWDDLESAYAQYRREHSYFTDDEVAKHGKDIVGLYFKNTMLRQNKNKSFAESEKDNFIHVNGNTPRQEIDRIVKKYTDASADDIDMDMYKERANDKGVKMQVAKKDDDGDGFYQGFKGLNYDLTTGEKITFDKFLHTFQVLPMSFEGASQTYETIAFCCKT